MVKTLLGGRAAEEVVFGNGEITSGCSNDLQQATNISIHSFTGGIQPDTSLASFDYNSMSERRKFEVDKSVQQFMQKSLSEVKDLLKKERHRLDSLSKELIEKESLDRAEVKRLISL